jgi:hypothetical protein
MRLRATFAAFALLSVLGCDRLEALIRQSAEPRVPPSPPSRPSSEAAPSASASGASAPARSPDGGAPRALPLDQKTRRALTLSPRRVHDPGVAIGKGRMAVLTDDALVVRDTTHFAEVTRVPLHGPRHLAVMSDGSFLAPDTSRTSWLLPHDTKARFFPRFIMLPESCVFGDRRVPDRFWVMAPFGTTLFGYALAPSSLGFLLTKDWVELDGFDGRAFGPLRDGSFLYSTPTAFRQFYGPSKKDDIAGDPRGVFRLLPASRPDTVWLLTRESADLFLLLAGKLVHQKKVVLATMPYDADADGRYLAVLELLQPTGEPWRFVLEVFDVDGKRRLRETLAADESLDPRTWLSALTRNRRLSLSADPPLVAVGGPEELTVWRADGGERLFHAP